MLMLTTRSWILILGATLLGGCLTEGDWEDHNRGGGSGSDPCAGVSCSGHGSCAGGTCSCNAGYAGSACDRCAPGTSGYPDCRKSAGCGCNSGSKARCAGPNSVTFCKDGCNWATTSCTTACGAKKAVGCATDSAGDQGCWCIPASESVMTWSVSNACGQAMTFQLFDVTTMTSWVSETIAGNGAIQYKIQCETGHQVCFGGWNSSFSWGCGQSCSLSRKGYCSTCADKTISLPLTCS